MPRIRLERGDKIYLGQGFNGKRAEFTVMQRFDDEVILYRTSTGKRDERNRWYYMGRSRGMHKLLDNELEQKQ